MKMKKIVATMLAGLMILAAAGCGAAKEESSSAGAAANPNGLKTVEQGKLLVAMEAQYPPFNWTQVDDANNGVAIKGNNTFANGYDVQMARKVAESLGLELEVVKLPWDSLSPAVQSGTADIVMAGMSPTADRRKSADFSEPYYESKLVVVVKKDSPYAKAKNFADLKDAKLTAQVNTFHAKAVKQVDGADIQAPMKDFAAMREALKSGIIDGYVSEKVEGLSASAALDDFTFIEIDGFKADPNDIAIAAAVKKGNKTLLDAVNEALSKISQEDRDKLMDDVIKNQPIAG